MGIAGIGHIIQSTSVFGPFLYGVGVLLLKPFGLHHILLAMVRFTPAGGIEMVKGREVAGALNIFYAELKAGLPFSPHVTAFYRKGLCRPLSSACLPWLTLSTAPRVRKTVR